MKKKEIKALLIIIMNNLKFIKENDENRLSIIENKLLRIEFKKKSLVRVRQEFLFFKTTEYLYIPKVYEYGNNEYPYIIMDFIDGVRLEDSMLDDRQIDLIFYYISSTLLHIHSCGICLNNINPRSFILKDNIPYLVDYSETSLNLNNYNDNNYNPAFISSEKFLRNSNHFASDIFSLGLLYLFCKKRRSILDDYDSDSYQSLLSNEELLSKTVKRVTNDEFIQKMLSVNTLNRPSGFEVYNFFSNKTKQNDNRFQELFIKSYLFKCQEQATKKLWKTKTLKYDFFDEINSFCF